MPLRNHEHLFEIVTRMPTDFEPWGQRSQPGDPLTQPDCSCHCRFFNRLDGGAGVDWGVCVNPRSPRSALLTFKEFGCPQFEQRYSDGYEDDERSTDWVGNEGSAEGSR
jgi:hypothetical protein